MILKAIRCLEAHKAEFGFGAREGQALALDQLTLYCTRLSGGTYVSVRNVLA